MCRRAETDFRFFPFGLQAFLRRNEEEKKHKKKKTAARAPAVKPRKKREKKKAQRPNPCEICGSVVHMTRNCTKKVRLSKKRKVVGPEAEYEPGAGSESESSFVEEDDDDDEQGLPARRGKMRADARKRRDFAEIPKFTLLSTLSAESRGETFVAGTFRTLVTDPQAGDEDVLESLLRLSQAAPVKPSAKPEVQHSSSPARAKPKRRPRAPRVTENQSPTAATPTRKSLKGPKKRSKPSSGRSFLVQALTAQRDENHENEVLNELEQALGL